MGCVINDENELAQPMHNLHLLLSLIYTLLPLLPLHCITALVLPPHTTTEALRNAEKVCIVPGYGLAVAQAGSVVADIALYLRKQVSSTE